VEGGYRAQDGEFFGQQNGVPSFLPQHMTESLNEERSGIENALKTFLRRFPHFYVFLINLTNPDCFTEFTPKKFLRQLNKDGVVVSLGSGVHRYGQQVVNVDVFPYTSVDVIADAAALPFASASVDGVLCEFLLEHVPDPSQIMTEIHRILKPGGLAYIAVPFLFPFHASPNDFHRWSQEGVRILCRDFELLQSGPRGGPTAALVLQTSFWLSTLLSFGNVPISRLLMAFFSLLFFPLKYLDLLLNRLRPAADGAATLYAVIRKPAGTTKA